MSSSCSTSNSLVWALVYTIMTLVVSTAQVFVVIYLYCTLSALPSYAECAIELLLQLAEAIDLSPPIFLFYSMAGHRSNAI